ncbi:MAG: hypothetical protein MN733_04130 [Nitrososphaera sp.]|nr:hypothetical protein [Nitrososphaera sp.]
MKSKKRDPLEDQVPSYGIEAFISTIDDKDELILAIKSANKRKALFTRRPQ